MLKRKCKKECIKDLPKALQQEVLDKKSLQSIIKRLCSHQILIAKTFMVG
nr:hypothetical protein [Helicobacter pylori]